VLGPTLRWRTEMPAERRRSGSTAHTDTTLLPREHRGLISPGVEKELDALDEAEELLAPTVHAQDRQAGKRGKRGKADKVDLVVDTWLAAMVLIGICGLAFLPLAFFYSRPSR